MKIILLASNFNKRLSMNLGTILNLYFLGFNTIFRTKYSIEGILDNIPYESAVFAASLKLYSKDELKIIRGLNFKLYNTLI